MAITRNSRFLWTILVFIITCVFSLPAYAKYAGGTGEPNDPYQIATPEDLMLLGESPNDYDKQFILTTDIDLDPNLPGGRVFTHAVIAHNASKSKSFKDASFTGSLDGKGHIIKSLILHGDKGENLGLFGVIGSGGEVTSLRIENATITGGENSRYLGVLAGINHGTVKNCCTTSRVLGEDQRDDLKESLVRIRTRLNNPEFVGGLAGSNDGTVSNCYAVSMVIGGWRCVSAGGLVAMNAGDVSNCYAEGEVIDGSGSAVGIGGLVGGNGGRITHSYATAKISVGERTDHSGGLVGAGSGLTTQCFWDTQTSGIKVSSGGTGLTTAQMTEPKTYSRNGWAGNPNWVIDAGRDYPRLSWEGRPGQTISETTIDWLAGSGTEYDPYIISTAEQLTMIGKTSLLWDKHFILANNIDLDPNLPGLHVFTESIIAPDLTPRRTITQKGVGLSFTGTFDGKGHTLHNLTLHNRDKPTSYVGLFGIVGERGQVVNLALVNVNITGVTYKFQGAIATLAGYNLGSISDCYVTGKATGDDDIGGLVGKNEGAITTCCTSVEVTGDKVYGIGGLVGCNQGTITNCYACGPVVGRGRCGMLGGLAGVSYRDGSITYSYSTGPVSSGKGSFDLGGFVGKNAGVITYCFWNIQTSRIRVSDGGMGLTTAQMMASQIYSHNGWASNPNWVLNNGKDYPHLMWEGTSGKRIPEPTTTWLNGNGTKDNPYKVATAEQLAFLGTASMLWDKHFILASDIDLAGIDARPIGSPEPFTGSFNGKGHAVHNLCIDANNVPLSDLGLFGIIGSQGRVTNLRLENVAITTGIGSLCCGALAGKNEGLITNCCAAGMVTGDDTLGGLVGSNTGTITKSYSTCTVTGTRNSWNVGGLVGYNVEDIMDCYATGNVTCNDISYNLGGLTGSNKGTIICSFAAGNVSAGVESHTLGGLTGDNKGSIANCYSTGNVTAREKSFPLAGLVGSNGGTVRHCYSIGRVGASRAAGGLVGTISGGSATSPAAVSSLVASSIKGSFWDTDTSGQQHSTGGTGKTTAEMHTAGTFLEAGWDFVDETANGTEDIWRMPEDDYPRLW